jgi:hypothetical protein
MNPLGAILTLLFSAIVLAAPRRYALLGVMGATCFITEGQVLDVGGFHFTAIRVAVLFGFIRIFARGELREMEYNAIDKGVVMFALISSVILIIREETGAAVVSELGALYNIFLPYFLFRVLFRDLKDIEDFLPVLAIVIVPFAFFMIQESFNGRNFFNIFGGVNTSDEFRDGHFRCSAAFRSPITAGTFGATVMPFFVGLYLTGRRRPYAVVGIAAATMIVICSRSSGPLLAYGSGILALLFWRWRERMRTVRWALLITIVSLHLYMKAPVWFLMGHMSDIVGGGGWHRAEIVDAAYKNFGSWWFAGTNQTGSWVATELSFGGADLTNQFVVAGVHAGIASLILFIWIIVRCYRFLGLAMQRVRGISPDIEMLLWSFGASLYATIVNFFSVSYFDQIYMVWYLLLAMIASASFAILKEQPAVVPASEDAPEKTDGFAAA